MPLLKLPLSSEIQVSFANAISAISKDSSSISPTSVDNNYSNDKEKYRGTLHTIYSSRSAMRGAEVTGNLLLWVPHAQNHLIMHACVGSKISAWQ